MKLVLLVAAAIGVLYFMKKTSPISAITTTAGK